MALMQIYSILDKKVTRFGPPLSFTHDEEVKRHLRNAVNKEGNDLNRYPEEFDLYRLGHMDESDGRLTSLAVPERIATLVDLKDKTSISNGKAL